MKKLKLNIQLFAATASIKNERVGDYSIENNNETQKITFTVKRTSGTTYWQDNKTLTFTLKYYNNDGTQTTLTQSVQFNFPSGSVGASKSTSVNFTVPHKTDGTQSITYDASITTGTSAGTLHPTGSATLETIPRASSITVNDANIGSSTNIVINKASASFTTTLYYKASGQNSFTKIVDKTANQVYGWTVPTSFYALIPNAKTITCQFYAETYSSNTLIGTSSTVTATFTATGNPTISSSSATDTNLTTIALTGNSANMVKYTSNVQISVTASGQNSATISSITVNGYNTTLSGTNPKTGTITFNGATTNSFEIKVNDSRSYQTTTTKTMTMINYVPLTINATVKRNTPTDGKVNININGNYYNGSFGSQNNTLTVEYRYKESTSSTWGNWTVLTTTLSGNTYSGTTQLSGLTYTNIYNFELRATDKTGTKSITGITVSKGQPVYWWNENGFYTISKLFLGVNGMEDYNAAGFTHDQYGNWKHKRNTSSDTWSIANNSGTNKFTVYPETGDLKLAGKIMVGNFFNNVNANDYIDFGIYYLGTGCSNVPTNWFYLIPIRASTSNSSDLIQLGFDANCNMYIRFRNGSTWGNWVQK